MARRSVQIMLVAAHPADSFDQAGGTLAHHVARGDRVTILIAMTGVRSHHGRLQAEKSRAGKEFDVEQRIQQAAEEKLEEVRKACRILGFDDVRDLGFEDDEVLVTREMIEAIADVIREVRPDILISEHPFENAGLTMHATIGQATIRAREIAAGIGHGTQVGHNVPSVYFMNPMAWEGSISLGYGGTSRADLYIDVTDVIEKKVQAMDCISSQYYGGAYSRKCAEIQDGGHGNRARVAYAEQFQSYFPMVRYTLPITNAQLDTDEPPETIMGRLSEMTGGLMPLPPNMAFTPKYRRSKEKYDE